MKFHLVVSFLLLSKILFAQTDSRIESILKIPRTQLVKLNLPEAETVKYIPCDFAGDNFEVQTIQTILENLTTIKVYYVYTQYKQSASFDQFELDRKRLKWFASAFPNILNDILVEWQILEQTGCADHSEGDSYFHGFVVVHRPGPDSEMRKLEVDAITAYIDNPTETFEETQIDPILSQLPVSGTSSESNSNVVNKSTSAKFKDGDYALYEHFQFYQHYDPEYKKPVRIDEWVTVSFVVTDSGKIDSLVYKETYPDGAVHQVDNAFESMPDWKPATVNGKPVSSTVEMEIRVSYSPDVNGIYTRDGIRPDFSNDFKTKPILIEESRNVNMLVTTEQISVKVSSVYKGLELLKDIENAALVMDVTGSMTSHVAAMLNWVRTYEMKTPFTSYTFFNDGDGKTTKQKKIGETGGIYMARTSAEVGNTVKEAMSKGDGGETPENDLEAVIYAFKNDDQAHAAVLIGDNYSEVKDLELLTNITRPVHVILCAAPKFVRTDYLKIAKDTGGLFIINGVIIDLSKVVKGDVVKIQMIDYKYNGSDFEILYKGEINY